MTFGSRGYTKADYARTLAATLAYFLAQQGDATGLLTFDEQVREYLPARHRPGHLRQLMLALEKPAAGAATDLAAPLRRIAELVRKRGLIVLISDLLAPIETLEAPLALLTAARHEVIVFQVLDPAELTFDFTDRRALPRSRNGPRSFPRARRSRAPTTSAASTSISPPCARICQRLGITHVQLSTAQPLELALFDFLKAARARLRRGGKNRSVDVDVDGDVCRQPEPLTSSPRSFSSVRSRSSGRSSFTSSGGRRARSRRSAR